ncbi:hypothetical protein KFL_009080040 [Klebsormidium nitens]|uniref:Uncharacterized protein n=1 Tax=Klebsormidium nitens TaxID=105231 RepID=A0A1Y1IMK5_KLENI|nr:hypothetical protein KFL_009080040 [Klebsormidium nitens]|eukprot:GAQ92034.1 hypothetical protein KFL_009080040 [Klebsormidium nitens]
MPHYCIHLLCSQVAGDRDALIRKDVDRGVCLVQVGDNHTCIPDDSDDVCPVGDDRNALIRKDVDRGVCLVQNRRLVTTPVIRNFKTMRTAQLFFEMSVVLGRSRRGGGGRWERGEQSRGVGMPARIDVLATLVGLADAGGYARTPSLWVVVVSQPSSLSDCRGVGMLDCPANWAGLWDPMGWVPLRW